ncbi:hypothetical protein N7462_005121 [Penicillium macrosclerotiorum]|uniref:uncharacterized protein n=1 Tax=Penicillium macrosclerotiorum TaxID=303699 RepID=UPI0025476CA3|nr:uncharacterized protein N7462_005121 [Penicillium macrosclerotiorum]KAJ5690729.1 hypothetical protein N7462_005121 [Penicillium macrosclerotiorum]
MDTVVSKPPTAMGQGEQSIVHPFFRQEFVPSPKPTSSLASTPVPPPGNNEPTPNTLPLENSVTNSHLETETSTPCASDSAMPRVAVPLSPDEDPNAGRRKRRKTERTKQSEHDQPLQAGLSSWLGMKSLSETTSNAISTGTSTGTMAHPSPCGSLESQINAAAPTEQPKFTDQKGQEDANDMQRKILKLNPNGRLLSSPPIDSPGNVSQNRGSSKRGRARKVESKLVSLKYNPRSERNLGQLIEDILGSRKNVKPAAPPRRPVQDVATDKPTHPFFLKKVSQKELDNVTAGDSQTAPPILDSKRPMKQPQSGTLETKREIQTIGQSSMFARRTNKFAELIDPLWPPKDLVHIRSIDSPKTLPISSLLGSDRKKSKTASIIVTDQENILLTSTAHARKTAQLSLQLLHNDKTSLRLPGRHTASGRVLQAAIDSQMSWCLPSHQPSRTPSCPIIKRLYSTLLTSVSAFDCGKYESQLWVHKYSPKMTEDVLQVGREIQVLRDWLQHLKITAVDTGKSKEGAKSNTKNDKKRKKKRKNTEKLDGFIVSSEEEASEMDNLSGSDDELAGEVTVSSSQRTVVRSGDIAMHAHQGSDKGRMTNAILLSGPPGCGKTASVYAIAKELDFEVFEINSGSRRSARDMLERVGDMTQNHLVHLLNENDDPSCKTRDPPAVDDAKQNKLFSFFTGQPSKNIKPEKKLTPSPLPETEAKRTREQKQSLILLEEVDILFEEDRQFWTGVLTLISQSKRPIVITCNDESLVPIQDMSLHAILRYQKPPPDLALDYLLLVAANEGHVLKRNAVSKLYNASGMDIRRSLMDLNFWCQMAVGSQKAGLDWILPIWPPGANVDQNSERLRVLSLNTYESYMGWFNRDTFLDKESLPKETEALENTFHWWRLSIQDAEDAAGASVAESLLPDQYNSMSKLEKLDILSQEADYLETRSVLDILCTGCPMEMSKDIVDRSAPPLPESHRSNYIDAYPLLQADLQPEYPLLTESIGITFDAFISRVFRPSTENVEIAGATRIFNGWAKSAARRNILPSSLPGYRKVFEPLMRAPYYMPASGRHAPSFENSLAPITEDIAPYVRSIMVFDGRLKQYRDGLFAIWSQEEGIGGKRMRTTRASRAALEGGDKASSRRERWFSDDINYYWVQGTGCTEWQQALYQMGHFHVQSIFESNLDGSNQALGR